MDFFTQIFSYSGSIYGLTVHIIDIDQSSKYYPLDNNGIEVLEISNGLNQLVLDGTLVYHDRTGMLMPFVSKQNVVAEVVLSKLKQEEDGNFSLQTSDATEKLQQTFLVDKFEITKRTDIEVTYKISFVSIFQQKLLETVVFSNYNGGSMPTNVLDIFRTCLLAAGLVPDSKSFDEVKSNVDINYITCGTDNMYTVFSYLMSRMYYYPNAHDSSLKFVWNDPSDSTFKLFDLAKINSSKAIANVLLTMNASDLEKTAYDGGNYIASSRKFSTSDVYKMMFQRNVSDYSYDANTFSMDSIETSDILAYHNASNLTTRDEQNELVQQPEASAGNGNTVSRCSMWNNDLDIYQEQVKSLFDHNSIVINTVGVVHRKPTDIINLGFQKDSRDIQSDEQKKVDEWAQKYSGLVGKWIVAKVRHVLFPSKGQYRQNLVLIRNSI